MIQQSNKNKLEEMREILTKLQEYKIFSLDLVPDSRVNTLTI